MHRNIFELFSNVKFRTRCAIIWASDLIQPDLSVHKFASSTKKYFCGQEKFVKNMQTFTSLCSSILHSITNIGFALVNNLDQFSTPKPGKKSLRYRSKKNIKILRLNSLSYQNTFLSKMRSRILNKFYQLLYRKHPQSDTQFAN